MSIGSLQLVRTWGLVVQDGSPAGSQRCNLRPRCKTNTLGSAFLSSSSDLCIGRSLVQDGWSTRVWHHVHRVSRINPASTPGACPFARASILSVAEQSKGIAFSNLKAAALAVIRGFAALQGYPLVVQCGPALALMAFSVWGLGPTMRLLRRVVNKKEDGKWATSRTQHVVASYIRPICLWIGVIIICRAFDPVVLSSEASHAIKARFINFVQSLSTVLAFAFCTASLTQQIQKSLMESQDKENSRSLGLQFVGNTVYTSVWVAAVCLFMELLGFSTQKWITAGGFGTVLLTLAGREIFTNFLSSIMIHATRPFVENEWIQTKIEGQEVSGTVEHVGWWSPTVIRGDDREAVHIPNHKFTVSVVRNLSQKTHWRIKTHFGISHLDVGKITYIVADMRKVISKHPQVEQQRLHRRAFFDNIDPENQALLILVSCFVKTSHFEEYLRVKEVILLDLLRVISHHNARLATPIRSVQRILDENEARQAPFRDVGSSHDRRGPRYMIEAAAVAVNDSEEPEMVRSDTALQSPEVGKDNFVKDFGKENTLKEFGKENVLKEIVAENISKEMAKESGINTSPVKGIQSMDEISDPKAKTKPKEKAPVGTDVSSKSVASGSTETLQPSPNMKPQLEGLDSMGLNSNDITLLKAAFEKPPVDIPEGPVESGDILSTEKAGGKSLMEQQKVPKAESSNEPAEQLVVATGTDTLIKEQLDDDPWREQPQVLNQPTTTPTPKQDTAQSGARSLEETVQTSQVQGQAQVSIPAPVSRLQSVEENLVLGVALDGPKRTLPLDDDDIQPPAKPRELVTSRNASGITPSKDRRDPPSTNPQQNLSGASSFDGRDRER